MRSMPAAAWMMSMALAASAAPSTAAASPAPAYTPVVPGQPLLFPRDFGSHPDFRTEWWYVTGWLESADGQPLGFQITFFRTKPAIDPDNPSAFAPRQIIIAHCALSDPALGRLRVDQRVRRAGLGLADAREADTGVWIDDWSLKRTAAAHGGEPGTYRARVAAVGFELALNLRETEAVLVNGESGLSRKGPAATAASYYYSEPHLAVSGSISREAARTAVKGEAWLDHEWSSEYLDPESQGWDWVGLDLDDGGAIMAFRIRAPDGTQRWAGATLRSAQGETQVLTPEQITFQPGRRWTSPRTGASYPVQWHLRLADREIDLQPLMDDQENDARLSTGAIYWEGAVRMHERGKAIGKGYLELTGYGRPMVLK